MKIYKYLFMLVCLISATSCKKYLDVKPVGKTIPTSVAEYDALLDNDAIVRYNFVDNNAGSMLGYLTDDLELSDGLGKITYVANNHPNMDRFYGYTFRQPYKNPNVSDNFWNYGFQNVFYFNNVINGIGALNFKNGPDEAAGESSIAQAKVDRAWWYLNAAMVYGPVYKPSGGNNNKILPFRTQSDINAPMEDLSTQEELFAKTSSDIRSSLADIPDNVNWPSRPNKTTALALMAYYHLFTQKYDSVAYYANLAWTAASSKGVDAIIYDYNTLSLTTPSNPVASLLNSSDGLIRAGNNREILFFRMADYSAGNIATSSSPSYPSTELLSLFDKQNDLRYKWFFIDSQGYKTTFSGVTYDDGIRTQNFRGSATATATQNGKTMMTEGFTYPEVLLMRAEGYARTGRLAEAIADLNTLRRFRYKTGTANLTVGAQDDVIKAVLDERRRELATIGLKRFMDLKRFSLETGKPWSKSKVTHQFDGKTFDGIVNSTDFMLPIPNFILQYNPQWNVPLDNRSW